MSNEGLIEQAKDYLRMMYMPELHTVAAAAVTEDGTVFTAVNSHHFSGFVCAETAVLSAILNVDSPVKITRLVAVISRADGYVPDKVGVVNSCGKCRQIWLDYMPGAKMLIDNNGTVEERSLQDLLPFAYQKDAA